MYAVAGKRSLRFYTELVLVTVLSLVAANVWVRLLSKSLDRYFPGSLIVDLIVAVVMTVLAVYILNAVFKKKKSIYSVSEEEDHPLHSRQAVLHHHSHHL